MEKNKVYEFYLTKMMNKLTSYDAIISNRKEIDRRWYYLAFPMTVIDDLRNVVRDSPTPSR